MIFIIILYYLFVFLTTDLIFNSVYIPSLINNLDLAYVLVCLHVLWNLLQGQVGGAKALMFVNNLDLVCLGCCVYKYSGTF